MSNSKNTTRMATHTRAEVLTGGFRDDCFLMIVVSDISQKMEYHFYTSRNSLKSMTYFAYGLSIELSSLLH